MHTIAAFLAEAKKAGADLVLDERVDQWTESHDNIKVHTVQNTYESGRLLISTGAWTNRLLGLPKKLLKPKRVPVHWIEVPKDKKYISLAFTLVRSPPKSACTQ